MSHLSDLFASSDLPTTVRFNGYVLCEGCSRQQHEKHSAIARCQCDLCAEEGAA